MDHEGGCEMSNSESPVNPLVDPPTAQTDPLRWGESFRNASQRMLDNDQLRANLRRATTTIRNKRAARVEESPDWEDLRLNAEAVKRYSLNHLPELLEQLEEQVKNHGGSVHWAKDADEANRIITQLIRQQNVTEVVKVKSMLTQEIGLNEYLEEQGISAWETDLAELIVQLGEDRPSHIVVPAIHRNRSEIKALFAQGMDSSEQPSSDDPQQLVEAARRHLRELFLRAKVAVSGANLMVAETGQLAIFESEGNGRMCLTLPETLISVVGIEKVIPTMRDAESITQLLPRSATGERMNPYTSWWNGIVPGDGPQEFHLVLVDNGRSSVLADPVGRQALGCIRCGACMNVCPVYELIGGHAYQSVYPGPIGAVLTPQLVGAASEKGSVSSLPFASTLCGACFEVCPVRIDIPSILVDLRQRVNSAKPRPDGWSAAMKAATIPLGSGLGMRTAEIMLPPGRILAGKDRRLQHLPWPVSAWTDSRDVPAPPEQSFRQWMRKHGKEGK